VFWHSYIRIVRHVGSIVLSEKLCLSLRRCLFSCSALDFVDAKLIFGIEIASACRTTILIGIRTSWGRHNHDPRVVEKADAASLPLLGVGFLTVIS
jgi:hypothetical protein